VEILFQDAPVACKTLFAECPLVIQTCVCSNKEVNDHGQEEGKKKESYPQEGYSKESRSQESSKKESHSQEGYS
jgi:hypothetical protein